MIDTSKYNLNELGMWVHLLAKGGELEAAQTYLNVIQARISALCALCGSEPEPESEPKTLLEVAQGTESEPVDSIRDAQGRVTRISTQADDPGYNPEIHLNQELKIFCDGVHFPTAHTADTVKGLVRYYEKNAGGRIKTQEVRGKVEIRD